MVTINNLSDGDYHWRARAVDSEGNTSDWQEFGTAGNIDFKIQKPVLIVPGFLGSFENPDPDRDPTNSGELVMDPILDVYDNIFIAFDLNGYTPGEDLFTFPYDWRRFNSVSSAALKDKISQIRGICDCEKINVIAHSMGGLVSRDYIESNGYQNDIDQLFMLGTPNAGGPEAYLAWEGGIVHDRRANVFLKILAHEKTRTPLEYIRDIVHSASQLLPVYEYLKPDATGIFLTYPDGYPVNDFLDFSSLSSINSAAKITKLAESGVRITAIAGNNSQNNTIGGYRIVDSPVPGKWEHGYPKNYDSFFGDHGLILTSGDGTVPTYSAHFLNLPNVENISMNSDHLLLPTNAFDEIFQAIRGVAVSPIMQTNPFETIMVIRVLSPVDFQVIDPLGRKIGKNFATEQNINQIPSGYYSGFSNSNREFVVIPSPMEGEYKIITEGTDSGSYGVETSYITSDSTIIKEFTAKTDEGVESDLEFNFDPDAPESTEITPVDQTSPTSSISLSGTPGSNGWYKSNVQVSLSAADNTGGVGVYKTEYSLDNGITWTEYATPFTISNESSSNTVKYRSEDYVGNLESVKTQIIKIDKTPPEAKIHFDPATRYFKIDGVDNVSVTTTTRVNTQNYTVTDEAGHTLKINLTSAYLPPYVTIGNAATVEGASLDVIVKSLRYNNGPTITLPINNLHYEWTNTIISNQSILKTLAQSITILGKVLLNSTYDSATNKTILNKLQGTTNVTQILNGMRLLNVTTNKGVVGWEY